MESAVSATARTADPNSTCLKGDVLQRNAAAGEQPCGREVDRLVALVGRSAHVLSNLLTGLSCQVDLAWPNQEESSGSRPGYAEMMDLLRHANAEIQRLRAACADVSAGAGLPADN